MAENGWRAKTGGLRQTNPPRGRFTHVFRLRTTPDQLERVKKECADMGRSQQEFVRTAIDWYIEELYRVQGVSPTIASKIVQDEIRIAKVASLPKEKRKIKPQIDSALRDGRSSEDRALLRLRRHLESK
jgi:hypothetical protein